jgi:hypothetical protein
LTSPASLLPYFELPHFKQTIYSTWIKCLFKSDIPKFQELNLGNLIIWNLLKRKPDLSKFYWWGLSYSNCRYRGSYCWTNGSMLLITSSIVASSILASGSFYYTEVHSLNSADDIDCLVSQLPFRAGPWAWLWLTWGFMNRSAPDIVGRILRWVLALRPKTTAGSETSLRHYFYGAVHLATTTFVWKIMLTVNKS